MRTNANRCFGLRAWLAWVIVLCGWGAVWAAAPAAEAPEYNVKAGLIAAFTRYTTWPAGTFATPATPIVIGVLGDDPFGDVLMQTAAAQRGERPLEVRRVQTVAAAGACHVVFIGRNNTRSEAEWLAALANQPVLTIGESGQTINRGGVLEFVTIDKSVRFEVSWPAMERTGLKLRAALLTSARKVHQPPRPAP